MTPWTVACQAPLSMGILQARILEWVAMPSSRGCSQPRDQTRSPTLQADSLPSEPQGKPMNSVVGHLSLFQGIFLTQELNRGLLHCRQILYQLSYQGSPKKGPSMCRSRPRAFRKRQGPQRKRGCPVHWEEGEEAGVEMGGG